MVLAAGALMIPGVAFGQMHDRYAAAQREREVRDTRAERDTRDARDSRNDRNASNNRDRYDRGDRFETTRRNDRTDVRVDINVGRYEPQYRPPTRIERVWIEPVYRTECQQVWVEPVYRTECQRVWVEPVYEIRQVVDYRFGRRIIREERVLVCAGHFEERPIQVLVCAGHYDSVERQVIVAAGHWEERTVVAYDRPSGINLNFGYRW